MTNRQLGDPVVHKDDDAFNRWPFSQRLARMIATFDAREGAPVIGIYGKWGSGKTSVLNFLKKVLETEHADQVVLLSFNPWLFKDNETLLKRFFEELFFVMGRSSQSTREQFGHMLAEFGGVLGFLASGAGTATKELGKAFLKTIEEVRDDVREAMQTADKKVVVLIDDLDRLDRDEILQLLKIVRLTANFPNVIYLLAFDDEMVGRAVAQKFGSDGDAGRQFLEKIVQYPYTLPAVPRERLMTFVEQQAIAALDHAGVTLPDDDWLRFKTLARDGLARRLTTPRQAIRYGNALRFALPMLKGEVDVADQMSIEGLRVLYPELYAVVRDNKRVFAVEDDPEGYPSLDAGPKRRTLYDKDGIDARIEAALHSVAPDEADSARTLIAALFKTMPLRPQGIARPRYFDRYFSYGIAADEIGDLELEELLHVSTGEAVQRIKTLYARNPRELLQLLLKRADNASMQTLLTLAQALIGASPHLDETSQIRPRDLAYVIAQLVLRPNALAQSWAEDHPARPVEIYEIWKVGQDLPLSLALYFREAIHRAAAEHERDRNRRQRSDTLIREESWRALDKALASRLADEAKLDWRVMLRERADAPPLMFEWGRLDRPAQRAWLAALLTEPDAVAPFLRASVADVSALSLSFVWEELGSLIDIDTLKKAARHAGESVTDPETGNIIRTFLMGCDERNARAARASARDTNEAESS
ncbi:hypothetical protein; putative P-loop ATPase (COG4928) [Bradyrhizobium sp. ORS 278]|uniref:KAP family P-loop NTPase fold protein n=1 Tax=Bradyrhizobium sp. (strain ORS 278) TaxID=114615 RepID=UPI0001507FC8|nr:P-loop NTPase fold protein [Bradyrhizobium sp. ORS 278]CAL80248.1 hypothetical protein; putative P-loop ATPase (COG4928) [Bradyrhizobium sp. ORS 278]